MKGVTEMVHLKKRRAFVGSLGCVGVLIYVYWGCGFFFAWPWAYGCTCTLCFQQGNLLASFRSFFSWPTDMLC
jgi:hypothetical protein